MNTASSRVFRGVILALVLVVLTTTTAWAGASARDGALNLRTSAPLPGTTCARPPETALSIDSDLRVPSGISAWSIDHFLAGATPLPPLGAAFKLAEARYRVNALYLLAHAMLESNFGRSYIAQSFHNLFGWTAYDRDPVAYATRFPSFATSVDYVAMQISRMYLDSSGVYYGGAPTLRGMYRYATDPRWETSIARIANSLCLPTLAGRGITFESTLSVTTVRPGESTELTITASDGSALPDGLRLAARARPVGDEGGLTDAIDTYALTPAASERGTFRLPVQAGALPGAYTLDFLLLDSDGALLPASDQIAIPPVTLDVVARHAVTYSVNQTSVGRFASIESVGSDAISVGTGATAKVEVLFQPTALVDPREPGPAAPVTLATIELPDSLEPGESRGFQLAPNADLQFPGVLFVRVVGVDVAGRPLDLATGAFSLTRDTRSVGAGANGTAAIPLLVIAPLDEEFPSAAPVTVDPQQPPVPGAGPAAAPGVVPTAAPESALPGSPAPASTPASAHPTTGPTRSPGSGPGA